MNKNEAPEDRPAGKRAHCAVVCTALVLIGQSELFRGAAGAGSGTGAQTVFTGVQDTALSRGLPARPGSRPADAYGVQYDRPRTVDCTGTTGLQELLQAVDDMSAAKSSTKEDWQERSPRRAAGSIMTFSTTSPSPAGTTKRRERASASSSPPGLAERIVCTIANDETKDYHGEPAAGQFVLPASLLGKLRTTSPGLRGSPGSGLASAPTCCC